MATVRISGELRDHVTTYIERLFEGRINAAKAHVKSFASKAGPAWYAQNTHPEVLALWHSQDKEEIAKWIYSEDDITLHVIYKTGDGESTGTYLINCPIDPSGKHLPLSRKWGQYSGNRAKFAAAEIDGLTEAIQAENRIIREKETLKEQVNGLLQQCGTLQQAYKIFPSILEFIPPKYVEKFNQPVEKREKVEIELPDNFVTSLTKARMLKDVASDQSSAG